MPKAPTEMTPKEALEKLDNLAQWYESDVVSKGYDEAYVQECLKYLKEKYPKGKE